MYQEPCACVASLGMGSKVAQYRCLSSREGWKGRDGRFERDTDRVNRPEQVTAEGYFRLELLRYRSGGGIRVDLCMAGSAPSHVREPAICTELVGLVHPHSDIQGEGRL